MRAEEEAGRAREQLTATQVDIVSAVEMVEKVDRAFANISGDVSEVHALLKDMSAENQVQAAALSEVTGTLRILDQATQQKAAMVEETSAAARTLSAASRVLADDASKFTIVRGTATKGRRSSEFNSGTELATPSLPRASVAAFGREPSSVHGDWQAF